MTTIIESISAQFVGHKALAEAAIDQLSDEELSTQGPNGGNSIAVICWHVSGNLRSRFTEFLNSDGEKPWREREGEFQARTVTRADLLTMWEVGWEVLLATLSTLDDDRLMVTVTIRGRPYWSTRPSIVRSRTSAITWARSFAWRNRCAERTGRS